jgi:putative mycofactocin binding protein MftB
MDAPCYRLHPACRVREEKFGLLFYDSRGPKLLFAATGSALPETFFSRPETQEGILARFDDLSRQRLMKFFEKLSIGGFIHQ